MRHSLLFARARGGPQALTVRDALDMATMGGARVLGRADEIGSLEVGKLADLAVWRLDTLAHIDIADPSPRWCSAPAATGTVARQRQTVVEQDHLSAIDADALARKSEPPAAPCWQEQECEFR